MECRRLIAVEIICPQLRQKVDKHLIVGRTVYLIDHQHDRFGRSRTHPAQLCKKFFQADIVRTFYQLRQRFGKLLLAVRTHDPCPLDHDLRKSAGKYRRRRKVLCSDPLKIQQEHKIIHLQIFCQRPERRCLAILAPLVDHKILFSVHIELFNFIQSVVKTHHIMFS